MIGLAHRFPARAPYEPPAFGFGALDEYEGPIPPMPTWIPGPNDPTVVPTEYLQIIPPVAADGTLLSWYNPVDWAKGAWSGTKKVGGWAWTGGKWVFTKVLDPCTYFLTVTLPAQHIPVLKDIIRKYGCSRTGQMLGSIALQAALAAAGMGPLAKFAGQVGIMFFYSCLCSKWQQELKLPSGQQLPADQQPPTQAGVMSTPVIVGLLAAAAAVAYALSRRVPASPAASVVSAPPDPSSSPPSPLPPTPSSPLPPVVRDGEGSRARRHGARYRAPRRSWA